MENLVIKFFSNREEFEEICGGPRMEYSENLEDCWVDDKTLAFSRTGDLQDLMEDVTAKVLVDTQGMDIEEAQGYVHSVADYVFETLLKEGYKIVRE